MEKAAGVAVMLVGLLLIYLVISGKLTAFLAALTRPALVQVGS